jgi:hypothetical protein
MSIDSRGRVSWVPSYDDLGMHPVEVEVFDTHTRARQGFQLRVDQGILLGTGLSWRGHTSSGTPLDYLDHVSFHEPWGRLISFPMPWRDSGDSMGEVPELATSAMVDSKRFGFVPAIGFSWADAQGNPDLTSDSEPTNNSWSNQETRAEFLQDGRRLCGSRAAVLPVPRERDQRLQRLAHAVGVGRLDQHVRGLL